LLTRAGFLWQKREVGINRTSLVIQVGPAVVFPLESQWAAGSGDSAIESSPVSFPVPLNAHAGKDHAMEKKTLLSSATGCDPARSRELAGLNPREHWCELAPDAIVCLDEQWRVLFFNRAADEMFQASDTLAIGQPPWQCAPLLAILEELHLNTLVSDREGRRRTVRQVELGQAGFPPYEAAVSVAGESGNRVFTVCIRDVSRVNPTPQALYQSQRRQLVGSLAGGIAHDFNNILTAVICQIDLALMDQELPAPVRDSLNQAIKSARRGAELNTKLLQFSRRTESRPAPVRLTQQVEETVFLLRRTIDRRIQVRFDPPREELWLAWIDEGQFMQVLMNLSLNARDAMPKGGEISFELANRKFTPEEARSPRHPGEFVQVSVRDTGHGMSPEVLGRLFEPYFTTREFGKGAGLGLSIANHVVVEHGGWMEVESELGCGSRFHVFLPRAMSAEPAKAEPDAPVAAGAALEGYEMVLLVDDEQPVREVVQAMLTFRGYQVIEAADGAEAVERFRAAVGTVNLVLLDIQMPRMNGWDTMERIHELNPRVPVLLLSGGDSDPPGDGSALSRAAGILRKPFASPELLRAVRKALDKARRVA
jgi:signal transduction histidine kinase/ActR/RegA family two-component response regulator